MAKNSAEKEVDELIVQLLKEAKEGEHCEKCKYACEIVDAPLLDGYAEACMYCHRFPPSYITWRILI